jgi:alanine racemase
MTSSGILQIHLPAVQANWRHVANRLSNGAQCAAVVKANAYSVGMAKIAPALYAAGCQHFFVATLTEAVALRHLLPDVTIFVLGGCKPGAEPAFLTHKLVPVIYSLELLQHWLAYCDSTQEAHACVLKMDTGMTRLGLSIAEVDQLLMDAPKLPFLNPILFMSHLACADEPEHPQNELQLNRFKDALGKVRRYFPAIKASFANSSGSFLGDDYHFDMVRIGAALYGINPQPGRKNPLAPVIALKLPILQVRLLNEQASIGYGATMELPPGRRLAVVAGGYADGLHRTLGFQPVGNISGVEVKAIGRMSMDSCIFDVSHIQGPLPQHVQVIGGDLTLDRLMSNNKSLGYEVLTSLGARFVRVYEESRDE